MADNFSEVTSQSWFSRIGGAIKGIFFGLLLIAGAVMLLWWNEGRAVRRIKALREGSHVVVPVGSDRVDAGNEGKLVHMTGLAITGETLSDAEFGVTTNALKLERVAEMYQWTEQKKSETTKNLGGSTTTTTTYDYTKNWQPHRVDSGQFKHPEGHANPLAMPFQERHLVAGKVTVGAFTLSQSLVGKIGGAVALPVTSADALPAPLKARSQLVDGKIYIGTNVATPQIGDQRISFKVTGATPVSLVSRQVQNTFEPYRTKNGALVELLQVGTVSADEMFAHAKEMNMLLTWGLRLLGWLLMFAGFAMVFNPLVVLADVVPFLGGLVGMGTSLIAFLLATPGALVVVAVAWIVYRPLLGGALIIAAGGLVVLITKKLKKRTPAGPVPMPAPVATSAPVTPQADGAVPYGIDQRPMPADEAIDGLAPQQVGAFQRGKVQDGEGIPNTRMQYAHYTLVGAKTPGIVLGVFVHLSAADAQQSLAGQEHAPTTEQRLNTEPSFYRVPAGPEGAEFYYTRGHIGFLVQAWHGEQELNTFMAAFPY